MGRMRSCHASQDMSARPIRGRERENVERLPNAKDSAKHGLGVRGTSSVGRASASQAEGREFEPRVPLQNPFFRRALRMSFFFADP